MKKGKLLSLIILNVITITAVILSIYAFSFEKDATVGSLVGGLSVIMAFIIFRLTINVEATRSEKKIILIISAILTSIVTFFILDYLSKPNLPPPEVVKNTESLDMKDIVYLDISSQNYSCDANPANVKTTISTDNTWNVKCNNPWIKAEKIGNTLDINIEANPTSATRKGTIFIDAENIQKSFIVTQSNKNLKYDNLLSKIENEQYWVAIYNNRYGFINDNHETVIDFKYDYASSFHENCCLIKLENKYGYINRKGHMIVKNIYNEGLDFSGGLAAVRDDKGWGFVDKVGNLIIETDFEDVLSSFNNNGKARIKRFGQVYNIDKQGKRIDD